MPLVDLDDPAELRARWSALAAVAHATGFDRRWYADDNGWYHQDETGSDLRMVRLDGARAVLFGFHTQHSRTGGADLLAGSPEWIGQPEVRRRMAAGQLGFVYGSFNGTWARAAYPGDPWQPLDDGFAPIASWVTSDEEAARELVEWAAEWADYLGGLDDLLPVGVALIRTAGSSGLTGEVLRDLFERLGIGPRSPQDPDLRAGLVAAAQFGDGVVAAGAIESLGRTGRMSATYTDNPSYGEPAGFAEPPSYGEPAGHAEAPSYGERGGYAQTSSYGESGGYPSYGEAGGYAETPSYGEAGGFAETPSYGEPGGYAQAPYREAEGPGETTAFVAAVDDDGAEEELFVVPPGVSPFTGQLIDDQLIGEPFIPEPPITPEPPFPAEPPLRPEPPFTPDPPPYQPEPQPEPEPRRDADSYGVTGKKRRFGRKKKHEDNDPLAILGLADPAEYDEQPSPAPEQSGPHEQEQTYGPAAPQHNQAPYGEAQYGPASYGQSQYGQASYGQDQYGQDRYDDGQDASPEQYLGDRRLPSAEPPRVGGPVEDGEDFYASLFVDAPAAASYTPDVPTDVAADWSADAPSPFTPLTNIPPSPSDDTGVLSPVDDTGALSRADESGIVSPVDDTGALSPADESGIVSPVDDTGALSPADESGIVSPVDDTGALSPADESGIVSPVDDTGALSPADESGVLSPVDDTSALSPVDESEVLSPVDGTDASVAGPEEMPGGTAGEAADDEAPTAEIAAVVDDIEAPVDDSVESVESERLDLEAEADGLVGASVGDDLDVHGVDGEARIAEADSADDVEAAAESPLDDNAAEPQLSANGGDAPFEQDAAAGGVAPVEQEAADGGDTRGVQAASASGDARGVQEAAADGGVPRGVHEAAADGGVARGVQAAAADGGVARGVQPAAADGGDARGVQAASAGGDASAVREVGASADAVVVGDEDDTAALQAVGGDDVEEEYYPTDVSPFAAGGGAAEDDGYGRGLPLLTNGFRPIDPADLQPGEHGYELGGEVFHDELIGDGDWTADQLGDLPPPSPPEADAPQTTAPETTAPETTAPETTALETAGLGAAGLNTAGLDAAGLETASPETGGLETGRLETAWPEAAEVSDGEVTAQIEAVGDDDPDALRNEPSEHSEPGRGDGLDGLRSEPEGLFEADREDEPDGLSEDSQESFEAEQLYGSADGGRAQDERLEAEQDFEFEQSESDQQAEPLVEDEPVGSPSRLASAVAAAALEARSPEAATTALEAPEADTAESVPVEVPERLVAPAASSGGMAIAGLGLVGADAPKVEPRPGSIEEAMRSEYERPRPRPKESAALVALREWCRARTKIVPSGFTIQVQVLDPARPSYRFDLEPPEVDDPEYGADRLAELLGDLWVAESQSEQGGWLFARLDAAGRTLRIDRWYDQVPEWWDHPIEQRLDVDGLVRRLNGRGPDWQPSYLEKLYTTAR